MLRGRYKLISQLIRTLLTEKINGTDRQLIGNLDITSFTSDSALLCNISEYLPRSIVQRVVRQRKWEGEISLCARLEEDIGGSPTTNGNVVNRVENFNSNFPHINIEVVEVLYSE